MGDVGPSLSIDTLFKVASPSFLLILTSHRRRPRPRCLLEKAFQDD